MQEKNNNIEQNVETQPQENNEVTYTQADVDRMIADATKGMFTQEKVNEIVEKRLAKAKEKAEKEKTQAEELAKLSTEERKAKEFEILMAEKQAEYEVQMAEFTKMKAEFEKSQLLAQVQKELSERNLPIGCSEMLLGKDVETTMANINEFEKAFNESLQQNINSKLKSSSSPKIELKGEEKGKDPSKMSLSEFIEYQNKNKN
jgi:hypothetical protein